MQVQWPHLALVVGACTAVFNVAAVAQVPAETPEQVAQQYLAAVRDTNWQAVAALMHPNALAQFHDLFRPFLECDTPEATQVRQQLFGVLSSAEAARLSDTVLVASLFRSSARREDNLAALLATAQLRVIGHVDEGPDTVHVVTRISFAIDSMRVSTLEAVSFGRYQTTWRLLLKADFSAMGAMLRRLCSAGG